MEDSEAQTALDYLGKPQPFGDKRLSLTGGGGGVTAPATPSVGSRAQAARILLSGAAPSPAGPSDMDQALKAAGLARQVAALVPSPEQTTRGEFKTSLSDEVRSAGGGGLSEGEMALARSLRGPVSGGSSFGGEEFSATASPETLAQFGEGGIQVGGNAGEIVGGVSEGSTVASGAAGGASALGSAIPVLGTAYALAQDIVSDKSDPRKAADATLIALSVFSMGAFKAIDEISGALGGPQLGDLFEAVFGGGEPSHAQREAKEVGGRIAPTAKGMQDTVAGVTSLDDLYKRLVTYGSGTTGGTSGLAMSVGLPLDAKALQGAVDAGYVTLPKGFTDAISYLSARGGAETAHVVVGNPNGSYPVFSQDGFFKALAANPGSLEVGLQAGVDQGSLGPLNTAIAASILQRYAALRPQPEMPVMPPSPPPTVNTGGPSGALDFARSLIDDPNAGP